MNIIIAIGVLGFIFVCKKIQSKYKISTKNRFRVINKMYDE